METPLSTLIRAKRILKEVDKGVTNTELHFASKNCLPEAVAIFATFLIFRENASCAIIKSLICHRVLFIMIMYFAKEQIDFL